MPAAYRTQITHGLWLTGRAWADLVSFNPDFGPRLRVQITRVYARDLDLAAYDRDVRLFLAEVDRDLARVARGLTLSPSSGFVVSAWPPARVSRASPDAGGARPWSSSR